VGIPGEHADGGSFAAGALEAGAPGAPVTPRGAGGAVPAGCGGGLRALVAPGWPAAAVEPDGGGVGLVSELPVPALAALARAWRRDLAAHVIAVTGSVGQTSTKDLISAPLAPHPPVPPNRPNYNPEIRLPLAILGAPLGTQVMVLEMGMRGFGQI